MKTSATPAPRIADHPVLDLLNTRFISDGELVDAWQTDGDVQRWLEQSPMPGTAGSTARRGLLAAARNLRELVRPLVEARKLGKKLQLEPLNELLLASPSALRLEQTKAGEIALQRRWRARGPEQALAPWAELAAELLAYGDFALIRKCESDDCVLWFYDRTKSHRRRWCSMAACGNRHKVAAYRERERGE